MGQKGARAAPGIAGTDGGEGWEPALVCSEAYSWLLPLGRSSAFLRSPPALPSDIQPRAVL